MNGCVQQPNKELHALSWHENTQHAEEKKKSK